jgi:hypothetical protein
MSRPEVVVELADYPRFVEDVSAGGLFVPDGGLELNCECELIVRGHGGEMALPARVVYVDPARGTGLELIGFGPTIRERLVALAEAPLADPEPEPPAEGDAAEKGDDGEDADEGDDKPKPHNLQDRLRGLTLAQQVRKANSSDPSTRIMLERMYGKNVWEALLRNTRLTAPEVARLARMGTLPRVQLENIVNNGAWLQIPEVRRALLTNPRLGTDQIMRVLRLMPKHELKVAATTTAYTYAVRDAAKRLVRDD